MKKKKIKRHPLATKDLFERDLEKFIRAIWLLMGIKTSKEEILTHDKAINKFTVFRESVLRGE